LTTKEKIAQMRMNLLAKREAQKDKEAKEESKEE
jgi:hypothetical protein